jgi:hypothetical protein
VERNSFWKFRQARAGRCQRTDGLKGEQRDYFAPRDAAEHGRFCPSAKGGAPEPSGCAGPHGENTWAPWVRFHGSPFEQTDASRRFSERSVIAVAKFPRDHQKPAFLASVVSLITRWGAGLRCGKSRPVATSGGSGRPNHPLDTGFYSACAHATEGKPAGHAQSSYATHPWVATPIAPITADATTITAPTFCQRVSVGPKYLTSIGLPSQ